MNFPKINAPWWFMPIADGVILDLTRGLTFVLAMACFAAMVGVLFRRLRKPKRFTLRALLIIVGQMVGPLGIAIFTGGQIAFDDRAFELNRLPLYVGLLGICLGWLYQVGRIDNDKLIIRTLRGRRTTKIEVQTERREGFREHPEITDYYIN